MNNKLNNKLNKVVCAQSPQIKQSVYCMLKQMCVKMDFNIFQNKFVGKKMKEISLYSKKSKEKKQSRNFK